MIGLGYVGLPLAARFAGAGFTVTGIDVDENRVKALNKGKCEFIGDTCLEFDLPYLVMRGRIRFSSKYADLSKSNIIIICVDTPLDKRGRPNLNHILYACDVIGQYLRRGTLVILESSIYPGFTKSVMKPTLEKSGLRAGEDFALAYSPERIDPNNQRYGLENIPKVIGGIDEFSGDIAAELYRSILQAEIVRVSDTMVAQATKMLENAYRMVNISLINELSSLFERIGVDTFEVIKAAATKPFGYQPFYPGPGIGGHCIPKDPLYLQYAARKSRVTLSLIEASVKIDRAASERLVRRLMMKLKEVKKNPRKAVVTVAGIAYKADVNDPRYSPAIPIVARLKDGGLKVSVYDPFVNKIEIDDAVCLPPSSLLDAAEGADAIVFVTDHTAFKKTKLSEIRSVMARDPILYDSRGMFRPERCSQEGFIYIGLGRPDMTVQKTG